MTTREERIEKIAAARAKAENLCKQFNELEIKFSKGEQVNPKDVTAIKDDLDAAVADYADNSKLLCYEDCAATGDAMLAAVKVRAYDVIRIKDVQENGCPMTHVVDTKSKEIDLLDMKKKLDNVGKEENWPHIAQKLNFLLTTERAKGLGIDPKTINDSYTMTAIAKEFDMGKNPVSNTNLLKSMQTVITAMLGDGYKATSHDVVFLKSVYARKGKKALSVQCADHRRFVGYLADVCHHITTGKSYEIESKEIKNK